MPVTVAMLRVIVLGLALLVGAVPNGTGAAAQTADAQQPRAGTETPAPAAVDFEAWETLATRAESALDDRATPSAALLALRAELAEQRTRFLGVQDANRERVAALQRQIEALGPPLPTPRPRPPRSPSAAPS